MGIPEIAKNLDVKCNVLIRVVDDTTGQVVAERTGHNSATQTMLIGIANYLKGDGVLNQGYEMLSRYIPRFMSLGTMGLLNQDEDENGLPLGIGVTDDPDMSEEDRFNEYLQQTPGFGADGYSAEYNNGREYFGLGPKYSDQAVKCELISDIFPRSEITYRTVIPEDESENPETIDLVLSAFISTGALARFRGENDYIFITETGLWSDSTYYGDSQGKPTGAGLVAGYRIVPINEDESDMSIPENREKLRSSILRVGKNQVVQVIWKIQINTASDTSAIYPDPPTPDPPGISHRIGVISSMLIIPSSILVDHCKYDGYNMMTLDINTGGNVKWDSSISDTHPYASFEYLDPDSTDPKNILGDTIPHNLPTKPLAMMFDVRDVDGNILSTIAKFYTKTPELKYLNLWNTIDGIDPSSWFKPKNSTLYQLVDRIYVIDDFFRHVSGVEFAIKKGDSTYELDAGEIASAKVYVFY